MRRWFMAAMAVSLVVVACGSDAELGAVDVWSRPASGPNGAVYLTLAGGATDTALVSVAVAADVAAEAQIHQTVIRDDGSMGMTEISSVDIPSGRDVMFVPGGVHVMLIDLARPLETGMAFDVTLTFQDGTQLTTQAEVRDE